MEIRKIQAREVEDYCKLQYRAYPSMRFGSKTDFDSFVERTLKSLDSNEFSIYGGFEKRVLVGSMMLYSYRINYLGEWLPLEGIGSVAVDLLHKREHVCQNMIAWAEQHMIDHKTPLAFLFPFRPDFYVPMGYGYGPMLYQYSLDPASLPNTEDKSKLKFLTTDDIPLIRDFESRMDSYSHGYIKKQDRELSDIFDRLSYQKSTQEKTVISTSQSVASSILMGSLFLEQAVRWGMVSLSPDRNLKEMNDFLRLPVPYGTPNC